MVIAIANVENIVAVSIF